MRVERRQGTHRNGWVAVAAITLAAALAGVAVTLLGSGPENNVTPAAVLALGREEGMTGDPGRDGWRVLEPGLEIAQLDLPLRSDIGDSRVVVIRIDPGVFDLKLLNASAPGRGQALTTREWCRRESLAAAINASMYQTDLKTSVGLMRTASHINNGRLNRDRAVLAFDRLNDEVPAVDIIDLTCQDFPVLREKYGTLVQSIRMVNCSGQSTWQQQPRRWSTAAIGLDRQGRVLFMHCRSPYSTHDFIDGLLSLPLDIRKAMYAEGGPEAQLYLKSGDFELERVGSFESGFMESDENSGAWPVPNVVGVVRRPGSRG